MLYAVHKRLLLNFYSIHVNYEEQFLSKGQLKLSSSVNFSIFIKEHLHPFKGYVFKKHVPNLEP